MLVKNKCQNVKQSFTQLDTCEDQVFLKLDKHEDVRNMNTHKNKNRQK